MFTILEAVRKDQVGHGPSEILLPCGVTVDAMEGVFLGVAGLVVVDGDGGSIGTDRDV